MVLLKWIFAVFLKLLFLGPFFSVATTPHLSLPQLKIAIQEYNKTASPVDQINSTFSYKLLYSRIPFAPSDPYKFYPDFQEKGNWRYLLGKKSKLTMDELKTGIAHYNKKALQIRQITDTASYKKFYKNIPNAPRDPSQFYSEFKEKGGWKFLLGKTCQKTLSYK